MKDNSKVQENIKCYSYSNSYIESFSIDQSDNLRNSIFFVSHEPIHIKIIAHEQESSLLLLHTNVYTISIHYGNYNWTIKRRYKNFLKLYEAYAFYLTKLNLKQVAVSAHLSNASGIDSILYSAQEKYFKIKLN